MKEQQKIIKIWNWVVILKCKKAKILCIFFCKNNFQKEIQYFHIYKLTLILNFTI